MIIGHTLSARDMSDLSQGKSSDLSYSLRYWFSHREKLVVVFIQQQLVIAKVRTAHVPVKIFGFHIEREHVGQNSVHGPRDVFGGRTCEISRCRQWSSAFVQKL